MRRIALALLVVAGCNEKSKATPSGEPPPAVSIEPTAASDAAISAIGKLLQPSAPVMGFAEIRPHLAPLAADCTKGSDIACAVFANLYRYGALVAHKAPAEEVARVDEACSKDKEPAACALAGEAHRDQATARQAGPLFTLACSQGIAEGCPLGDDLEALGHACDLGEFAGCQAVLARSGAEAGRRIARGLAIFQAACTRHHHPSCNAARELEARQAGPERPPR